MEGVENHWDPRRFLNEFCKVHTLRDSKHEGREKISLVFAYVFWGEKCFKFFHFVFIFFLLVYFLFLFASFETFLICDILFIRMWEG